MIIYFLYRLITIYEWLLIIYALLSWAPDLRNSQVGRIIGQLSRPFLSIFDRLPFICRARLYNCRCRYRPELYPTFVVDDFLMTQAIYQHFRSTERAFIDKAF